MNTNFETIKSEILRRAKDAHACTEQFSRAYKSEDMAQLCTVIKDNFWWACNNKVLTVDLLEQYKIEFAEHEIYVNISVERGFMLCDNATVKAYGNATVKACGSATVEACGSATVEACDSATVEAWGSATVEACDSATVKACDSATVKAWGNAYCTSYSTIECKLSDNAIYRVRSSNTVYYASDDIKFEKQ